MTELKNRVLLVVDDEVDVKPLFEHFFRNYTKNDDFDMIFTSSAKDCLDALEEIKDKKVLLLSDINMPNMSGVELSQEVRKRYPKIIISFISAGTTIPIKKEYYDFFFSKPVDFDYLVPRVLDILDEA